MSPARRSLMVLAGLAVAGAVAIAYAAVAAASEEHLVAQLRLVAWAGIGGAGLLVLGGGLLAAQLGRLQAARRRDTSQRLIRAGLAALDRVGGGST